MAGAATAPGRSPPQRADLAAWIAVTAGILGAFMAALDVSIVNSALPTIQGEIGASGTEGTWIATAYLVAEIVIISLSAWLEKLLGLRTFLVIATAGFTLFSMVCGLSNSLPMMVIGRIGQGFTGGALIPTAQTIIATRLPRSQQMVGIAALGLTATMGPLMGPLIGGWLTENVSWHYAFFLNLPVGVLTVTLLLMGLAHQDTDLKQLREADWLGIVGLAVGLGGLTVMLEEGQRELWFASALIQRMALLVAVGFAMVAAGQVVARHPVLKLPLLVDRQFGAIAIAGMALGGVIYGSAYAIPQFLAAIAGYDALQAGEVVLVSGFPSIAIMLVAGILMQRLDTRLAVAIGFGAMALSSFLNTNLTAQSVGGDFVLGQLIRGFGQVMAMLFLNMGAINSVPTSEAGDASALVNAARNLGGSFVLALIAVLQDQRMWLHSRRLEESLNANAPRVQQKVSDLSHSLGGLPTALQQLAGQIQRQALVMTYNDIFWVMGVGAIVVLPCALFLRPMGQGQDPSQAMMH